MKRKCGLMKDLFYMFLSKYRTRIAGGFTNRVGGK